MGARTAATRITPSELTTLDRLMAEMLAAAEQHDPHAHAVKNAEFHVTILQAARNDALERAWQMLEPFLRTYITATLPGVDLVWLATRHEKLIAALRAHARAGGRRFASISTRSRRRPLRSPSR